MSRLVKTLAPLLVAALLLAAAATAAPAPSTPPQASASQTCSVRNLWRKLGAYYVTKLSTRRVSCADAKSFSKLYHSCRHRRGGRFGYCPRVHGFRCSEHRYNRNPVFKSYDSDVLCTRGAQRIRETYNEQA
jgi:hypothetical protein